MPSQSLVGSTNGRPRQVPLRGAAAESRLRSRRPAHLRGSGAGAVALRTRCAVPGGDSMVGFEVGRRRRTQPQACAQQARLGVVDSVRILPGNNQDQMIMLRVQVLTTSRQTPNPTPTFVRVSRVGLCSCTCRTGGGWKHQVRGQGTRKVDWRWWRKQQRECPLALALQGVGAGRGVAAPDSRTETRWQVGAGRGHSRRAGSPPPQREHSEQEVWRQSICQNRDRDRDRIRGVLLTQNRNCLTVSSPPYSTTTVTATMAGNRMGAWVLLMGWASIREEWGSRGRIQVEAALLLPLVQSAR